MPSATALPLAHPAVRLVHLLLGLLGLSAIGYQLALTIDRGTSVANFFSFFTIESNLLTAAVFLWIATRPEGSAIQDRLRGAATLFMAITGIVFAVLLSVVSARLGLTAPWVNTVLHQVLPVAIVLDWLLVPATARIPRASALRWLLFPVAYLAYSLLRGPAVDFYPYPFMDPRVHGYDGVVLNAVLLAVPMALLALAVAIVGSRAAATTSSAVRTDASPSG